MADLYISILGKQGEPKSQMWPIMAAVLLITAAVSESANKIEPSSAHQLRRAGLSSFFPAPSRPWQQASNKVPLTRNHTPV